MALLFPTLNALDKQGVFTGNGRWHSGSESVQNALVTAIIMSVIILPIYGLVWHSRNTSVRAAQSQAKKFAGTKEVVSMRASLLCNRIELTAADGSITVVASNNPFHSELFYRCWHGGSDSTHFVVESNFTSHAMKHPRDGDEEEDESGSYLAMKLAPGQFSYEKFYK